MRIFFILTLVLYTVLSAPEIQSKNGVGAQNKDNALEVKPENVEFSKITENSRQVNGTQNISKNRANRSIIAVMGGVGAVVGGVRAAKVGVDVGIVATKGAIKVSKVIYEVVSALHKTGKEEIDAQKAAGTWAKPKAFDNRYDSKKKLNATLSNDTIAELPTSTLVYD
ncbi:hypothetical protein BB561_006331 [Smittium simulii]|uniref:Glycine zipper 2TM domain-containing protein n=1 Tax=Smittium simulii TaxID=133385 RepID=A0A2T9Y575_9FUNG|nr:hypothetical protein BB561_006331 [Smittium simulii]